MADQIAHGTNGQRGILLTVIQVRMEVLEQKEGSALELAHKSQRGNGITGLFAAGGLAVRGQPATGHGPDEQLAAVRKMFLVSTHLVDPFQYAVLFAGDDVQYRITGPDVDGQILTEGNTHRVSSKSSRTVWSGFSS
ncbi:MAG: hypothetical protein BWY71_01178 [Planctomycetes bacterium ADurb.Bin412]|nr:MAG: hypothetical protein BWY71_01178 [Planctomycetes bacterium ADurb.Bin412]